MALLGWAELRRRLGHIGAPHLCALTNPNPTQPTAQTSPSKLVICGVRRRLTAVSDHPLAPYRPAYLCACSPASVRYQGVCSSRMRTKGRIHIETAHKVHQLLLEEQAEHTALCLGTSGVASVCLRFEGTIKGVLHRAEGPARTTVSLSVFVSA